MTFEEAFAEMRKGKIIRRKNMFVEYQLIEDTLVSSETMNPLNVKDILADDWEIVEEPKLTFIQAFQALLDGKIVYNEIFELYYKLSNGKFYTSPYIYYLSSDNRINDDPFNSEELLSDEWKIVEWKIEK